MSISAESTAKSPFPWFGGKQKMAEDIIAMFPPHNVYVEVFGGGAAVLLSKAPAALEVYNDIYDGLVCFFRMLRERPDELVPMLELTPYSRSEWLHCRETWHLCQDEIERARRFFVCASQSFGGMGRSDREEGWRREKVPSHGKGWGGEKLGRMHLSRSASTANRVDHIWRFVERLRRVQIDNLDWRECLQRYDQPNAVFYLDPPYVPATRRSGGYHHELTVADHTELVERVLQLEGCAVVSGYDHDVYRPLVDAGFDKHQFTVLSTAGIMHAGRKRDQRVECLWVSPNGAMPTLFNHEERLMFRPVAL